MKTQEDFKRTALANHLGIEYFEYEDQYYIGDFNEQETEYEDQKEEYESFGDFISTECTLLEDELGTSSYNDCLFEYGSQEYYVYTDDEADQAWDESIDNYIEDCILPDMPESYRFYFDDERFKDDAKIDGRGHSLAGYDGNEYEEEGDDGEVYYIYRWN